MDRPDILRGDHNVIEPHAIDLGRIGDVVLAVGAFGDVVAEHEVADGELGDGSPAEAFEGAFAVFRDLEAFAGPFAGFCARADVRGEFAIEPQGELAIVLADVVALHHDFDALPLAAWRAGLAFGPEAVAPEAAVGALLNVVPVGVKHPAAGRGERAVASIRLDAGAEARVARGVLAGAALRPVCGRIVAAESAEVMQVRRVFGELHIEAREDASLDGIESLEKMAAGVLAKRGGDLEAFRAVGNDFEHFAIGVLDLIPTRLQGLQRAFFEVFDEEHGWMLFDAGVARMAFGDSGASRERFERESGGG